MPRVAKTHKDETIATPPLSSRLEPPTVDEFMGDMDMQQPPISPYTPTMPPDPADYWKGRREVYRLPNGAILVARNEVESSVYSTKGGTLVDEIYE